MSRRPRVLMIVRHFWPHGSDASAGIAIQTATALRRRGIHVEVLTARYASSWPETIVVREIPVHRVVSAPRNDWGSGRYMRGLGTWLQQHGHSFDILWVDSIREEAMVAVNVAKTPGSNRTPGIKTMVRSRGCGESSDAFWWQTSRHARRCAAVARNADVVVAGSAESERELLINGFESDRIVRISHGIDVTQGRSIERRCQARRALAAVNGDLQTDSDTPVLLCTAKMVRNEGLDLLVRAAQPLVMRYPQLRIWFIGDGPYRDTMYQQLRSDGVRSSIAMPGSFVDDEDLFAAADVYLQCDDDGFEYFMGKAIAWEVPIVAINHQAIRSFVDTGSRRPFVSIDQSNNEVASTSSQDESGANLIEWYERAASKDLRLALSRTLDHLPAARRHAGQLRRMLVRLRPLSSTMDAYLELITRLTQQSPPETWNHEAEAVS